MAGVSKQNLHRWLDDKADARAEKVADLWLKGWSQIKIAKECEIGRKKVRILLDKARALWLDRRNMALTDAIAEQLRRIDLIEAQAWEQWERSKQDAVENSMETSKDGFKKKQTIRPQTGDARYLDSMLKCVDMRCKLLGIYKPPEERSEMEVWGVVVAVDTPEQANAIMEYSEFQGRVVEGSAVPVAEVDEVVVEEPDPLDGV
jgi:hypothetical protein